MLARRLLMFAMILLVVTALSSALAPPRDTSPAPVSPTATPDGTAAGAATSGTIVERTIDAANAAPATVVVQEGDILSLTVETDEPAAIELEGLGPRRAATRESPVVFDVLPEVPGRYPVVLVNADETVERTVGTVRVVSREE
jgi:hypothetical protein